MTDPAPVSVSINGKRVAARLEATVAAVLMNERVLAFRTSVSGAPRAPLCGMGICQECRVTIDGVAHVRACMVRVAEGMRVETT